MKVLTKVLMMALVLGATNPILAKENNSLETLVTLKELDRGKIQLTYIGKTPEKLHVFIYNEKNREIFKETIRSKNGIKKPYNISNLPYGEYRFEIRVADAIVIHKVNHKAPDIVKLLVVPMGKSKFRMMVMGLAYKDFEILIYDVRRNRLLFQENIHQNENVGRIFDLKATGAKAVKLVLSHKNNVAQSKMINL